MEVGRLAQDSVLHGGSENSALRRTSHTEVEVSQLVEVLELQPLNPMP